MKTVKLSFDVEVQESSADGAETTTLSLRLPGGREVYAFGWGRGPKVVRTLKARLHEKVLEVLERDRERQEFSRKVFVTDGGSTVIVTEPGAYRIAHRGRGTSSLVITNERNPDGLARRHVSEMDPLGDFWEASLGIG